jgi:hypothetical protein
MEHETLIFLTDAHRRAASTNEAVRLASGVVVACLLGAPMKWLPRSHTLREPKMAATGQERDQPLSVVARLHGQTLPIGGSTPTHNQNGFCL